MSVTQVYKKVRVSDLQKGDVVSWGHDAEVIDVLISLTYPGRCCLFTTTGKTSMGLSDEIFLKVDA